MNDIERISWELDAFHKRDLYRKLTILCMALAHNCDRAVKGNSPYLTEKEESLERMFLYNAGLVIDRPDTDIDEILAFADEFIKSKR